MRCVARAFLSISLSPIHTHTRARAAPVLSIPLRLRLEPMATLLHPQFFPRTLNCQATAAAAAAINGAEDDYGDEEYDYDDRGSSTGGRSSSRSRSIRSRGASKSPSMTGPAGPSGGAGGTRRSIGSRSTMSRGGLDGANAFATERADEEQLLRDLEFSHDVSLGMGVGMVPNMGGGRAGGIGNSGEFSGRRTDSPPSLWGGGTADSATSDGRGGRSGGAGAGGAPAPAPGMLHRPGSAPDLRDADTLWELGVDTRRSPPLASEPPHLQRHAPPAYQIHGETLIGESAKALAVAYTTDHIKDAKDGVSTSESVR
jgi:hypothetical protein